MKSLYGIPVAACIRPCVIRIYVAAPDRRCGMNSAHMRWSALTTAPPAVWKDSPSACFRIQLALNATIARREKPGAIPLDGLDEHDVATDVDMRLVRRLSVHLIFIAPLLDAGAAVLLEFRLLRGWLMIGPLYKNEFPLSFEFFEM
jgi:hypothetical protein